MKGKNIVKKTGMKSSLNLKLLELNYIVYNKYYLPN
jgi:hypothetical protein